LSLLLASGTPVFAAESVNWSLYNEFKAFQLTGQSFAVKELTVKREAVEMVFTGEFYPAKFITGQVYGAIFIGEGRLHAVPWNEFEKDSVHRFLKSDNVDATFTRAVLCFADGTDTVFGNVPGRAVDLHKAQELAAEWPSKLLRQTGLNAGARMLQAMANGDKPGFFFASFSGGNHKEFGLVIDHQSRSLNTIFSLDAGEKGALYQYKGVLDGSDIWLAFYDDMDVKRRAAPYADAFDLVRVQKYRLDVDLRDAPHRLGVSAEMDVIAVRNGVRVLNFVLNEGLDEYDDARAKKGARLVSASLGDGSPLRYIQDEWDKSVWLEMPSSLNAGDRMTLKLKLESQKCFFTGRGTFYYPLISTSWYPRHRDGQLSQFDLTFHHQRDTTVVSNGQVVEAGDKEANGLITRWSVEQPVDFVTFAVGPFKLLSSFTKIGTRKIPVDYYSDPDSYVPIKGTFIQAELENTLQFFSAMFGEYPYERLAAAYCPRDYGQGLAALLMLPSTGRDSRGDFAFIAHETSHQWWGHKVRWRSYRDEWLSEGFAEYSGVLYTGTRMKPKDELELLKQMRADLLLAPGTDTGLGAGKLYQIGPLVYGYRLESRLSQGAYTTLIYDKGALVLRMLHFLMTDPKTGNGNDFFDLMKEFTTKYQGRSASTSDFMQLAEAHFINSAIGKGFQMKDLNWFMHQWVYGTELPNYRLEYRMETQPDGGKLLTGTLFQDNVPKEWFMPLPLEVQMSNGQHGMAIIYANGPSTPVKMQLPPGVKKVALDPELFVLSGKTTAEEKK
jgi:hypothetical protein